MPVFQDAFISYGRADSKAFAAKLNERLITAGLNVWYDFEDIPLGVDYQNQINDGIDKTHNFLFVISPHAVNSPYCAKEITRALKRKKRIIPLMHVEEITQESWRQRHPDGTDQDWAAYKAKGLHSSYQNLHPAIAKINFVFFREGIDDFEQSLQGLLEIFDRDRTYVHQHTFFLTKALEWRRNQQQSRHLLIAEGRQAAEDWLKKQFKDEQPPCIPTDLHSEFITESIKNANNLMTQVFLSHVDADQAVANQVGRTLMRRAIPIWRRQTDLQKTSVDPQESIERGIEQADNVVFLLSPAALRSPACQQELEYAMSLNKRVITLLIEPLRVNVSGLYKRILIDCTAHQDAAKYALTANKLLKVLNQDAPHYQQHKTLLVQALKWRRQDQNPSILLRGYNLNYFESWLKVAQQRQDYPPISLQIEFLEASAQRPADASLDVFISYSRADSDLARKLNDALQTQGKTTWFDQECIASGTDFQQEIQRGIEQSDNFVFIISPTAIRSNYCTDEAAYAQQMNKRVVTVLYRMVAAKDLPPSLANLQWIDFNRHGGDFYANFSELVRTLDTDREHVRRHTQWLQRSLAWSQKDKSADLLLRGNEFAIADQWLQTAKQQQKHPPVTDLQQEFIAASQSAIQAERRREKRQMLVLKSLLGSVSVLLCISVVSSLWVWRQRTQLDLDQQADEAVNLLSTQPVDGLLEALNLVGKSQARLQTVRPSVRSSLRDAIAVPVERNRFEGHLDAIWSAVFSPNGQWIASSGFDRTIRLWDLKGNLIGQPFEGHTEEIWSVAFSPDGQRIASASSDKTIRLWTLRGEQIGQPFQGHTDHVKSVAFSPGGDAIASGGADKTVRLWDLWGNPIGQPFRGHTGMVLSVAFSPDGTLIASSGADKTVRLWDLQGNPIGQPFKGHEKAVNSVAFSPNGRLIASGGADRVIRLWDLQGNPFGQTAQGHEDAVMAVAFSPGGRLIASASDDNTVRLWDWQGRAVGRPLRGHEFYVYTVAFSPDGQTLLSGSEDKTLRLWPVQDALFYNPLRGHSEDVASVAISGDSQTIVSGSVDRTIRVWGPDGQPVGRPFQGHTAPVLSVDVSGDGQTIVSGGADQTVRLWNRIGNLMAPPFQGHRGRVYAVALHPSQPLIASAGEDATVRLWDRQGKPIGQPFKVEGDAVHAIAFAPDGQSLASGSDDGVIQRWDVEGNLIGPSFSVHLDDINALAFSPDGQTIVSASRDQTLRLVQLADGTISEPFRGHKSTIQDVAFSPDGQFIVSASRDQTVRLWDLEGVPVGQPFRGHQGSVRAVAFSPNGQFIVSGGHDGLLKRWKGGDLLTWLGLGCDRLQAHPLLVTPETPAARRAGKVCRTWLPKK
ncbi:MAG: TIR domain-containing protein [Leptolyngbyaceae cyanobacterium MO_188.B28]|nr:TIR domain-containing protein [Leptolyngbyaceae cyanobacterium MO_188.B28]